MKMQRNERGWMIAAALVASVPVHSVASRAAAQYLAGHSIGVSDSTVVMGEPFADGQPSALLIYDWAPATGELTYRETLLGPNPGLGLYVALDGDLLASTSVTQQVVIDVFGREDGIWQHDATLENAAFSSLRSLDLSGSSLIVGTQEGAFIYERTDAGWVERQISLDPELVPSARAAIDGDIAAVTLNRQDAQGTEAVVVLQRQGDVWQQQSILDVTDVETYGVVDVEIDFPRLVFHVPSWPSVGTGTYVFEWSGSEWVQQNRLRRAVDVDLNGDGSGGKSGGDLSIVLAYFGQTGEDLVADAVVDGVIDLLDVGATATSRPCDFSYISRAEPVATFAGDRLAVVCISDEFVEACDYEAVVRIYEVAGGEWTRINKFRLGDAGRCAVALADDWLLVNRTEDSLTIDENVLDVRQPGFEPQQLSHTLVAVPIDWDAVAADDEANLTEPARCFDLQVVLLGDDAKLDWTATELQLTTDGVLFQHPVGGDIEPHAAFLNYWPALPYDSFFADPPALFEGMYIGFAHGPDWTQQSVDAAFFDVHSGYAPGASTIARFTVMDGSEMTITGRSTSGTAEIDYPFSFSIDLDGCAGDVDGDGDTDQSDLGELLAAYSLGTDGGDLDGDGDTDQSDLGILLADYDCNVW